MLVTRVSMYSGIERTLEMPITQEQIDRYLQGEHLHVAFSNLSMADREFIHTGITDDEWQEMFPKEEEED